MTLININNFLAYLHVEVCEELLVAVLAREPLYPIVDLHVFVQICFLCELVLTSKHWAFEGALPRVNAEVVEKIVPFPEESAL